MLLIIKNILTDGMYDVNFHQCMMDQTSKCLVMTEHYLNEGSIIQAAEENLNKKARFNSCKN